MGFIREKDKEVNKLLMTLFINKALTIKELATILKKDIYYIEDLVFYLEIRGIITKSTINNDYFFTKDGVYTYYCEYQTQFFDNLHKYFSELGYDSCDYSNFIKERLYLYYLDGEYDAESGFYFDVHDGLSEEVLINQYKSWLRTRSLSLNGIDGLKN